MDTPYLSKAPYIGMLRFAHPQLSPFWFLFLQASELPGHLFLVLGFGKGQTLTETQTLNAETW
jgi:hypothetical protein